MAITGMPYGSLDSNLPALMAAWIFLEAVHRYVGVKLAGHDDVLAVRRHVNTVRRLGLRDQEQHAFLDGGFHHQHVVAVDLLAFAGSHQFSGFLPVDHVHVIRVFGGAPCFIGGRPFSMPPT
jgi:hypothetical protein